MTGLHWYHGEMAFWIPPAASRETYHYRAGIINRPPAGGRRNRENSISALRKIACSSRVHGRRCSGQRAVSNFLRFHQKRRRRRLFTADRLCSGVHLLQGRPFSVRVGIIMAARFFPSRDHGRSQPMVQASWQRVGRQLFPVMYAGIHPVMLGA